MGPDSRCGSALNQPPRPSSAEYAIIDRLHPAEIGPGDPIRDGVHSVFRAFPLRFGLELIFARENSVWRRRRVIYVRNRPVGGAARAGRQHADKEDYSHPTPALRN